MAVTIAPVFCRNDSVTAVPRPPQPSTPRRTAELACVPKTVLGFRMVKPAVAAAATPTNSRRPTLVSLRIVHVLSPCVARNQSGRFYTSAFAVRRPGSTGSG